MQGEKITPPGKSATPSQSLGTDCHHLATKDVVLVTESSQLALNQARDLAFNPQLSNEREQLLPLHVNNFLLNFYLEKSP